MPNIIKALGVIFTFIIMSFLEKFIKGIVIVTATITTINEIAKRISSNIEDKKETRQKSKEDEDVIDI